MIMAVLFAGCGSSSESVHVDTTELRQRTATVFSLQAALYGYYDAFQSLFEEHGQTYQSACDGGGSVTYSFSESLLPATLSFDQCVVAVSEDNVTSVTKNGTLTFTQLEEYDGFSVAFSEGFSHSVAMASGESIETLIAAPSLFRYYDDGIRENIISSYDLNLSCNALPFQATDIVTGIDYYEKAFTSSPHSGTFTMSTQEAFELSAFVIHNAVASMIALDENGDIFLNEVLFKYRGKEYLLSIRSPNLFQMQGTTLDVSAYLWR